MKAYRWISCILITVLLTGSTCINLQAAKVGKSLKPGAEAVTKTNVKMYKGHDSGSKKLAKIPKGRTVKIKKTVTSGWYKVCYNGKEIFQAAQPHYYISPVSHDGVSC